MTSAEREFAEQLTSEGRLWFFEPKTFELPRPYVSYRPDFFIVDSAEFVEVVGTRQAFSQNRMVYDAFRAAYPSLKFRVVNVGAWSNGELKKRCTFPKRWYPRLNDGEISAPLRKLESSNPNPLAREIIGLVRSGKFTRIRHVADAIGVNYSSLYSAMHGKCSSKTVEYLTLKIRNMFSDSKET